MIDFHTHLLPGIDDGSKDLEQSLALLKQEREQGVSTVVATPHFYADQETIDGFMSKRRDAMHKVQALCGAQDMALPEVLAAAEVYYFPGISRAERTAALCLEGTDLLLLELPFAQWTERIYEEVRALIYQRQLSVILVHIERFYSCQKDKSIWHKMLELPLVLQINAGAFSRWTDRRILKKILASGRPVILGSDCHSPYRRPVTIAEGCALLNQKIGAGISARMMDEAQHLLNTHRSEATMEKGTFQKNHCGDI